MSKKKAFSGSTMTLKDFHGGSIPSDLPLPSAPGTVAKVPERSERQGSGSSWGGSGNRGFSAGDRGRQALGNNLQRGFEDKVSLSYLPNSANIGRNFDEDERKPLDSFPPRRSESEEDYQDRTRDRLTAGRFEPPGIEITRQYDVGLGGGQDRRSSQPSHQQAAFGRPLSGGGGGSVTAQQFGVSRSDGPAPAPAAVPNAWGIRRELDSAIGRDNISSESVASRFAQASAVDKVSSGRWQSRLSLGFEQQTERLVQPQHVDYLYDGQRVGLDSGNLSYGLQDSGNERGRHKFDNFSSEESRKGVSVEIGKTDAAYDLSTEMAPSNAAETARAGFAELAKVKSGHNAEYCGNVDYSWNKTKVCSDEAIDLDKTAGRQMSPVMDLNQGKNNNNYPKERPFVSPQVQNSYVGAAGPYYSARGAQNLCNSRDSFISDGAKSTGCSDFKVSANAVQNLDNEASRNRFGTEDARTSSPFGGHRAISSDINAVPPVTVSSIHVQPDSSARPKLKLLPRSKPLENTLEIAAVEQTENSHTGLMSKAYHSSSCALPVEFTSEAGNTTCPTVKPLGTSDIEEENRRSERRKLNLKPRSLPVEQLEASLEKERNSVFGGARPRELVLKERGVDDMVINGVNSVPVANIGKGNKMNSKEADQLRERIEQKVESMGSGSNNRQDGKIENIMLDRKVNNRHVERVDTSRSEWRDTDKKDHRVDMEKQELQKNVKRNDSRRNPQNNYRQERRLDIDKQDSWRRSEESPGSNSALQKSASSSLIEPPTHAAGKFGHGRPSSAMELAESFSRSASLVVNGQRVSTQRSSLTNHTVDDASGRKTLPFSRLTDSSVAREFYSSSVQRQINGY